LVLALALLASAVGAGVQALGGAPGGHITLGLTPNFPASEPLVTGDVLRLDVTAAADFAAHSSGTVIYYDSRYFSPCDAAGGAFTALDINPANPLCKAGPAFEDINAGNLSDYPAAWKDESTGLLLPEYAAFAAVALKIPYDLSARPATGVPNAGISWFTFYLKVTASTPPGETASVFISPDALRTTANRTAPMYFSAAPGGAGWLNVEVTLPARLDYTAEQAVPNPVTVNFTAGARGSLTGGIAYVRNVEAGTTIAQQSARRWPALTADMGYHHAGWAYAASPTDILPEDTHLGTVSGDVIDLVAVFAPNPVRVQLYLLDMSRPAGAQEIDLGEPLDIFVNDDYSAAVAALGSAIDAYPVDAANGWFLERLVKHWVVPETAGPVIRVEMARVHRGTWFITYAPGGGDVENLPLRTEKPRDAAVQVSAQMPTRRGYAFSRWQDAAGNAYAPGQSFAENRDLDLTAVWNRNPDPYVEGDLSRSLQYRSSLTLRLVTSAPGSVTWSSSSPGVASVNPGTGEVTGAGPGTATITGRDGDGFEARVSVTVSYVWWQWLIVIFLFGWIWY